MDFSSFAVLPRDRFWPAAVGCVFGFLVITTILSPNAIAAAAKRRIRRGAAKKTEKEKTKPKKVYTEEDLAGLRGNGMSVVGNEKPAAPDGAGTSKANGKTKTGVVPMSGLDQEYWRGKARGLPERIAAREQRIEAKKDEIKKLGNGGFVITTGMNDNIAYMQDRNTQLQELEKHKADLQKQLDQLQDEGRKVGAPSSWFR